MVVPEVEADGSAGIKNAVRIEVMFQGFQHFHSVGADLPFEPRSEQFSDAVVVAHASAGFLNGVQNSAMIFDEFVDVLEMRNEDEIKVGALLVAVRNMRSANGFRAGFAVCSDALINFRHAVPIYRALQGVDHDAEILNVVAHIAVVEAAAFPALADEPRKLHCSVLFANFGEFAFYEFLKRFVAVVEPEHQASFARFVAEGAEHFADYILLDAV